MFDYNLEKKIKDEINNNLIFQSQNSRQIIIFGAGRLGEVAYSQLCNSKMSENIVAFCDNEKMGKSVCGGRIPCLAPCDILQFDNPFVLIAVVHAKAIEKQLNDMEIDNMRYDKYVLLKNIQAVYKTYETLNDIISKETYLEILKYKLFRTGKLDCEKFYRLNQYFCVKPFEQTSDSKEIFIDCGAYVGDTLEQFIWKRAGIFKKIYAFEPDENNFKALNIRVNRLKSEWRLDDKIECIQCGIGEKCEEKFFKSDTQENFGLHFVNDDDNCEKQNIVSLDAFFDKKETRRVTFIKADIEGYERQMLLGARNIIEENLPKLAICIYHNPEDLYTIPLLIKSFSNRYKMDIRKHAYDDSEIVLYCYVD